jgi:hypothetical protein
MFCKRFKCIGFDSHGGDAELGVMVAKGLGAT